MKYYETIINEMKPWEVALTHIGGVIGLLLLPITFPCYMIYVAWLWKRADKDQRKDLKYVMSRYLWASLRFYITHDLKRLCYDYEQLNLL